DHLRPAEGLAAAVLLHNHVGDLLDPLVGREALVTRQALAAAADDVPLPRLARVHDLVHQVAAVRALHPRSPLARCAIRGSVPSRLRSTVLDKVSPGRRKVKELIFRSLAPPESKARAG